MKEITLVEQVHAAFSEAGYPEVEVESIINQSWDLEITNTSRVPELIGWKAFRIGGVAGNCFECYKAMNITEECLTYKTTELILDCGRKR